VGAFFNFFIFNYLKTGLEFSRKSAYFKKQTLPYMKRIITLFLSLASIAGLRAQVLSPTVISTTGGYTASASGSLSYTAGETITPTLNNTLHILTQGFQQPEKDVSASVEEVPGWTAEAFPNPTKDVLNLLIRSAQPGEYTWEVRDMQGASVLRSGNPEYVDGELTLQIDVNQLAAATYFLLLQDKSSKPYVVKFIKN